MAQKREVWILHECEVSIWQEDGIGGYISPAVREARFSQDVSIRALFEQIKEGQPGAAVKDVTTIPDGFEARIGEFFERKAEQVTPFDDRTKRFRVLFDFVNPAYNGTPPLEQDQLVLRDAAVVDWEVTGSDNDVLTARLGFVAERREA